MKAPSYTMRPCSLNEVRALCVEYHGYGGYGGSSTYAFGVYELGVLVAAYVWQPPSLGAAQSVSPDAPHSVLSLARMVAVPRTERVLNHVSKPLRAQMKRHIDRGRWPCLVTYSDEGQGHTGHVYRCSGWTATTRSKRPIYINSRGQRVTDKHPGSVRVNGFTYMQRWEHRVCAVGGELTHMEAHGWVRRPVRGKRWRSGNQAFECVKETGHVSLFDWADGGGSA